VTVCDNAREACPYLPAKERNLHHGFRDPSAAPPDKQAEAFRAVRDEIAAWLDAEFGR
jgi:arsenate reductase